MRAGVQKLSPLYLAGFIDQDTQRLAGAVQAMIDQGRKGGLQGVMFTVLGHAVDSFVWVENEPKKSPRDSPSLLLCSGAVLRTSGASARVATVSATWISSGRTAYIRSMKKAFESIQS